MGVSSDGKLLYGVCWDEEDALDDLLGPLGQAYHDGYGDGREWFNEVGLTNLELELHCSYEYSMPAIAVKGTLTTAYRGYPKLVVTTPNVAFWDADLDRAMDLLEIPADQRPAKGWWLTSMYG